MVKILSISYHRMRILCFENLLILSISYHRMRILCFENLLILSKSYHRMRILCFENLFHDLFRICLALFVCFFTSQKICFMLFKALFPFSKLFVGMSLTAIFSKAAHSKIQIPTTKGILTIKSQLMQLWNNNRFIRWAFTISTFPIVICDS